VVVNSEVEVSVDVTVDKVDWEVTVDVLVVPDRNGTPSGRPLGGPGGFIVVRNSTNCTIRWFLVKRLTVCRTDSMHTTESLQVRQYAVTSITNPLSHDKTNSSKPSHRRSQTMHTAVIALFRTSSRASCATRSGYAKVRRTVEGLTTNGS